MLRNVLHRRPIFGVAFALALLWFAPGAAAETEADCARQATGTAKAFGAALVEGSSTAIRVLLPSRGKVLLRLERFAPEQGYYSAGQVGALFRSFFEVGSVASYEVRRVDVGDDCRAIARLGVQATDREGRGIGLQVRLAIHREEDRWVVREIRESAR